MVWTKGSWLKLEWLPLTFLEFQWELWVACLWWTWEYHCSRRLEGVSIYLQSVWRVSSVRLEAKVNSTCAGGLRASSAQGSNGRVSARKHQPHWIGVFQPLGLKVLHYCHVSSISEWCPSDSSNAKFFSTIQELKGITISRSVICHSKCNWDWRGALISQLSQRPAVSVRYMLCGSKFDIRAFILASKPFIH